MHADSHSSRKKIVVQIPCYNESETIAQVIADIPRSIPNAEEVVVLVIDDGSQDDTAKVAKQAGADVVVRFAKNRGLAFAFQAGLKKALELGADVIVNTDGDNQYPGNLIPNLVSPILEGRADMVLGERQFDRCKNMSKFKRFLEKFGSSVVSLLSGVKTSDAVTGFRAFSREFATFLYIANVYTYTIESLFVASSRRFAVEGIPIVPNEVKRKSRLVTSVFHYITKSMSTIIRCVVRYRALAIFTWLSIPLFAVGIGAIVRFLLYHFIWEPEHTGHIQSVVLGGVLILAGLLFVVLGFLADAIATNRKILEEIMATLRERKK